MLLIDCTGVGFICVGLHAGHSAWLCLQEKDPFVDDYEAEFHIGSVKVWLKSLAYMIEMKEQLEITNFSGQEVGLLNVSVLYMLPR